MAAKDEREEGHRMCPVFCTVEVPAALLNLLLENAEEGTHYLIMDIEAGENIQGLIYQSQLSANPPRTSFFKWSVDEVYTYWKNNVCAPGDGSSTTLSAFTFVILDGQSVSEFEEGKGKATTLVLGSDAPDLQEKEDEVVLKSLRLEIENTSVELMCLETLTRCPSEIGKAFGLSIQPPPIFAAPPPMLPEGTRQTPLPGFQRLVEEEALIHVAQTFSLVRLLHTSNAGRYSLPS